MSKIIYYIILAFFIFICLAWETDVKPRIFTKPEDVHLRPEFKLAFWVHLCCGLVFTILYCLLVSLIPDYSMYRMAVCIACLAASIFIGSWITKLTLRKQFCRVAWANNMDPEDYAKEIAPEFVISDIFLHLTNQKYVKKRIRYYRSRRHISDACAWALIKRYCD